MDRWAWPTTVKVIVGLLVAAWLRGSSCCLVQMFELTGTFPAETGVFTDDINAGNEFISSHYPLEFAQDALFALGFAAIGLLGLLLARLVAPGDSRGPILSGTLMLAGGLGVAAQLVLIGAEPVATSPQYCDCGLLEEELMSRLMAFNIVQGIETWLTNGAIIAAAVGVVIAARPGVRAGMPVGWAYLGISRRSLGHRRRALGVLSRRSPSTCGAWSWSPRSCCRRGRSGSRCAQKTFVSAIRKSNCFRETDRREREMPVAWPWMVRITARRADTSRRVSRGTA